MGIIYHAQLYTRIFNRIRHAVTGKAWVREIKNNPSGKGDL